MTQQELLEIVTQPEEKLKAIFIDWLKTANEMIDFNGWKRRVFKKAIKQYVEEVIGEDEESEYSQDNIDISAERNYLKQEQRKRAGL